MYTAINRETAAIELASELNLKKTKFSWSAIIVGALFGLGISFLANLFGFSIGLTAFTTNASPQTLQFSGLLSLVVISIISMGMLGLIAGYLGASNTIIDKAQPNSMDGYIYGFGAWCLALMLSIALVWPTAHFVSNTVHELNPEITTQEIQLPNTPNAKVIAQNNNTGMITPANADLIVDETTAAKALASTAFIAFLLFFIGAISATIGGYCGYKNACEV